MKRETVHARWVKPNSNCNRAKISHAENPLQDYEIGCMLCMFLYVCVCVCEVIVYRTRRVCQPTKLHRAPGANKHFWRQAKNSPPHQHF